MASNPINNLDRPPHHSHGGGEYQAVQHHPQLPTTEDLKDISYSYPPLPLPPPTPASRHHDAAAAAAADAYAGCHFYQPHPELDSASYTPPPSLSQQQQTPHFMNNNFDRR